MSVEPKFVIWCPKLDYKSGGNVVLHNLAKDLKELDFPVRLFNPDGQSDDNPFCNEFATLADIDVQTIVIYPEVVEGNPLNAKNVVRWMLCDIGIHTANDVYKSWNPTDLVFHFSSFNSTYQLSDLEILYTFWIDPAVSNRGLQRKGSCYLFKKATRFHANIQMIHPKDAILLDHCSNSEIIQIFNEKEVFYNYDPHSYYDAMAVMCGCPSVIYPLAGVAKIDWFKSKASFQAFVNKSDNMSGIAYGLDDWDHAQATIGNAPREQLEALTYGKQTVKRFCDIVRAYYFGNHSNRSFKTVEQMIHHLGWDQMRVKRYESHHQNSQLDQLKQQIAEMKASKFWKAREWYFRTFKNG